MNEKPIIGIDLGGTNLRAANVTGSSIGNILSRRLQPNAPIESILEDIFTIVEDLDYSRTTGIGIGVPGLIDFERGLVIDVVNLPSWKEVPLQAILEEKFRLPVAVNNDANCFALAEFHFGKGRDLRSIAGVTIGTGLGTGIVIDGKLYAGANGGAGEFGMMEYRDKYFEYYCSGQFFTNVHGVDGEEVFKHASNGDVSALKMYEEMGMHLGKAMKAILLAIDPEMIVLGGSVKKAYPYFSSSLKKELEDFPYKTTIKKLRIEVSELENGGVLGAAALVKGLNV